MARILRCHPRRTQYDFHIYTDLDFWDTRRIVKDLAVVRRNYGNDPPGDEFPTQVVADGIGARGTRKIERRIERAVASPPRHVIVRSMLFDGEFEFDPLDYYPQRWPPALMIFFTHKRLPLEQTVLASAYQTVDLAWKDGLIRITRKQREGKVDTVVRTDADDRRRHQVPSCF